MMLHSDARWIHRGKALRIVLIGCLLNLTAGCFTLRPVDDEIPPPQANLRVRLNPEASARISAQAGRPVEQVVGQVIQADADSLVLAVRWGEMIGAQVGRLGPDVVRLARVEAVEITRPQLSPVRTALLAGGIAAVILALIGIGIESVDSGGDDGGGLPQPR